VGVVLSGTLDDGSAGLWAIQSCGGVTVVQDPAEALFADMPANAMKNVDVDHCLEVAKISVLLRRLAEEDLGPGTDFRVPDSIRTETKFATLEGDMEDMAALGRPSAFTCPQCHGALWEMTGDPLVRFRCHLGHAYSPDTLLAAQSEGIETALESGLRALREKAGVATKLADRFAAASPELSAEYRGKAEQLKKHMAVLGTLMTDPRFELRTETPSSRARPLGAASTRPRRAGKADR
jgi:two-component system chemotaxis response regulator CheB